MARAKLPERAREWLSKEETSNEVIGFALLSEQTGVLPPQSSDSRKAHISLGTGLTTQEPALVTPKDPRCQKYPQSWGGNWTLPVWPGCATTWDNPHQTSPCFYSGNSIQDERHQVKHCSNKQRTKREKPRIWTHAMPTQSDTSSGAGLHKWWKFNRVQRVWNQL